MRILTDADRLKLPRIRCSCGCWFEYDKSDTDFELSADLFPHVAKEQPYDVCIRSVRCPGPTCRIIHPSAPFPNYDDE